MHRLNTFYSLRYSLILGCVALCLSLPFSVQAQDSVHSDTSAVTKQIQEEHNEAAGESHEAGGEEKASLGRILPIWSAIPFVGILLSIALFPLIAPHFWHHHFPKVSAFWAILFAVPFLFVYGHEAWHEILHIYLADYIPFIILLWGLFTVSGGILVKGTLKGTPVMNLVMLLIGTFLSSVIGTTGSAMVMIRPMLRANAHRKNKVHVFIFFIFLVANIGGSLTPLGDPPLFLGFLHGVSFFWTFNLIKEMLFVAAILLTIFYIIDSYNYKKEGVVEDVVDEPEPLRVEGALNFLFLLGIIGGVLFSGFVHLGEVSILGVHVAVQNIIRDVWIVLMGLASLKTTAPSIRKGNDFNWFPILEVAYLFAGIFMTIIPALAILKAGEHGALASLVSSVKTNHDYFWITGILSSFLDNAPTYLTFFNTALGSLNLTEDQVRAAFAAGHALETYPDFIHLLTAISLGAVYMGANTYIGNAPNFMVKSICEEAGITMPSFFGYIFRWSLPILIPVFLLVTFVFL
ncbi:MAG: sodium:proton antiporter [Calditrichaeota bacterium]|nr:MAG: sodium:proton antiporter [Calditrichota bacterium]